MKIKSFISLLLIVIIVTSPGCLESKKSPVPNETKNATPVPIFTTPEQELSTSNGTHLKINGTFETWSRGYYSNKSYKNSYFKVITNYEGWIAFLDEQGYSIGSKGERTMNLEGQLFPGLDKTPKIITSDDFKEYFIIAAMMGMRKNAEGPEIEIKNISRVNNIVDVTVSRYDPGVGSAIISAPYHIVLVKKEQIQESSTFDFIDTQGRLMERSAGYDITSLEAGETGEVFNESGGIFTRKWDASNFLGFWRDSETGDSTETLAINQSILNNKHRVIERHNLIYTTRSIPIKYQIYRHTGKAPEGKEGFYQAIGWLGEKYVFFQGSRIAKVIFEQNATEEKELTIGESWELGEGYRLIANSISARDQAGRQSWLTLFKDSNTLVDIIMVQYGKGNFFTYQMNVSDGIPNFMIYCSRVESLPYKDAAYFNNTWLRSQDITEIREGQVYGIMEIISVNNGIIELRNKEPIDLAPENIINLMGDLNILVGRSRTDLEFYPFSIKKGGKSSVHISSPSLIKIISRSHPILENNIEINELEEDYYFGDFSQECIFPCEGKELNLSITGYYKRSGMKANILITMDNAFAENERLRNIEIKPVNEERIVFETITSGNLSGYKSPDVVIIRTLSDWNNVWQKHVSYLTQKPQLPVINSTNETVVAVFFGDSPGFDADLIDVTGEEQDVFINIRKMYSQKLSPIQPYIIVKFSKTEGNIILRTLKSEYN